MIPERPQIHPSVCGLYTMYAVFYLIKFRQEEITGFDDNNVLSFISKYMCIVNLAKVNMQVLQGVCYHFYSLFNYTKL